MFGLSALATKAVLGGILAACLLGGALYIKHIIAENALLTTINEANARDFKLYKNDVQANELAVAQAHASEIARLKTAALQKEKIAHDRQIPGQDAPVAPVLRNALAGLHPAS